MKIMTHLVAGYPTLKKSAEIALTFAENGADFLEVQIPFSDPVADGPTISAASACALEQKITPQDCFDLVKKIHKKTTIPIVIMTYANIFFRYGGERFCRMAHECGGSGLIIPDLPFDTENHEHFMALCRKNALHPIQVISPLTPEHRLRHIGKIAQGFLYCVGNLGTTGAQKKLYGNMAAYLKKVKKYCDLPLAVGFGISEKKQIALLKGKANIAVIGSALLEKYNKTPDPHKLEKLGDFVQSLESGAVSWRKFEISS